MIYSGVEENKEENKSNDERMNTQGTNNESAENNDNSNINRNTLRFIIHQDGNNNIQQELGCCERGMKRVAEIIIDSYVWINLLALLVAGILLLSRVNPDKTILGVVITIAILFFIKIVCEKYVKFLEDELEEMDRISRQRENFTLNWGHIRNTSFSIRSMRRMQRRIRRMAESNRRTMMLLSLDLNSSQVRGVDPFLLGQFPIYTYKSSISKDKVNKSAKKEESGINEGKDATREESTLDMHSEIESEYKFESESNSQTCTICFDNFGSGDQIKILPCFHQFHSACIDKWLSQNLTCPICHFSMSNLDNAFFGVGSETHQESPTPSVRSSTLALVQDNFDEVQMKM